MERGVSEEDCLEPTFAAAQRELHDDEKHGTRGLAWCIAGVGAFMAAGLLIFWAKATYFPAPHFLPGPGIEDADNLIKFLSDAYGEPEVEEHPTFVRLEFELLRNSTLTADFAGGRLRRVVTRCQPGTAGPGGVHEEGMMAMVGREWREDDPFRAWLRDQYVARRRTPDVPLKDHVFEEFGSAGILGHAEFEWDVEAVTLTDLSWDAE